MNTYLDSKVNEFVQTVTDQMMFSEARAGAAKEILSHIEEHIETALSYGLSKDDAVEEALKRMGSAQDLGMALNKIHQPKLDIVLPGLAISLCAIGVWNLMESPWLNLQILWAVIGFGLMAVVYSLPVRFFKNFIASLYGVAIVGLILSYFSGVIEDGQPYLSLAGLNIKIVDFAGVLFALGFPALGSRISSSNKFLTVSLAGLFLSPMAYFSYNGFIWPGLLFLISGLCYLQMSKVSTLSCLATGLLGSVMLTTRLAGSFVSVNDLNKAILLNAHTDYALRSMNQAMMAEAFAIMLFVVLVIYGIRRALAIKCFNLRSLAVVGICLMTVQILTSVLANVGLFPMISAGINIPFISYGGSGMIANFLIVGILLGCLKRKTILTHV